MVNVQTNDVKKDLGQVFTPTWVVETMLDELNYTVGNENILQQKILEPSFGEGVFFYTILDRLITVAKQHSYDPQQIAQMIQSNIWGVEYDEVLYQKTIHDLNTYLHNHDIPSVEWNFFRQDSLLFNTVNTFDYVVGNPPYIRIHNMTAEMRENVKRFSHSLGTTDLYIIFFELGLRWLNKDGQLAYITPNSWLKNTSQGSFRKELIDNGWLNKIIDFGSAPIFTDASTYTAITVLNKSDMSSEIVYTSHNGEFVQYETVILYESLLLNPKSPLVFGSQEEVNFLTTVSKRENRLGDVLSAQYGVATLRDKIFLNAPANVEQAVQKIVVKASKYKGELLNTRILFPYKEVDGVTVALTEEELQCYPVAYQYFLDNKEELLKRDIDSGAQWFQFGRSQGLQGTNKRKLVFSHVISSTQKTLQVFELPSETVVYSGMFIMENNALSLTEIKNILESEDFCTYAKISGKDMSGGFKTLSTKMLKEYRY